MIDRILCFILGHGWSVVIDRRTEEWLCRRCPAAVTVSRTSVLPLELVRPAPGGIVDVLAGDRLVLATIAIILAAAIAAAVVAALGALVAM